MTAIRYLLGLWLLAAGVNVPAQQAFPEAVNTIIPTLVQWGRNPVLVSVLRHHEAARTAFHADDTAKRPPFDNGPGAATLRRLARDTAAVRHLTLLDARGVPVAGTDRNGPADAEREKGFERAYRGGVGAVHVGALRHDVATGGRHIEVAIPVLDRRRSIGVLSVDVDVGALESLPAGQWQQAGLPAPRQAR